MTILTYAFLSNLCTSSDLVHTYTRVLLCLSHKRTLTCLDALGEDHDGAVRKWCESINEYDLNTGMYMYIHVLACSCWYYNILFTC